MPKIKPLSSYPQEYGEALMECLKRDGEFRIYRPSAADATTKGGAALSLRTKLYGLKNAIARFPDAAAERWGLTPEMVQPIYIYCDGDTVVIVPQNESADAKAIKAALAGGHVEAERTAAQGDAAAALANLMAMTQAERTQ